MEKESGNKHTGTTRPASAQNRRKIERKYSHLRSGKVSRKRKILGCSMKKLWLNEVISLEFLSNSDDLEKKRKEIR